MSIIYNGQHLECEREVRDWREHEFATTTRSPHHYRRKAAPKVLTFHWTGGERGHRGIATTLRRRQRGIHFTIDYRGTIWQYCDPAIVVAPHVGSFNRYAIGVEVQSRGVRRGPKAEAKLDALAPRAYELWVQTDLAAACPSKTYVTYTADQLDACLELATAFALAGVIPQHLVRVHRALGTPTTNARAGTWDRRIAKKHWPELEGVGFHFQVHPSKLDAGPLLASAFEEEGW